MLLSSSRNSNTSYTINKDLGIRNGHLELQFARPHAVCACLCATSVAQQLATTSSEGKAAVNRGVDSALLVASFKAIPRHKLDFHCCLYFIFKRASTVTSINLSIDHKLYREHNG